MVTREARSIPSDGVNECASTFNFTGPGLNVGGLLGKTKGRDMPPTGCSKLNGVDLAWWSPGGNLKRVEVFISAWFELKEDARCLG